jgi:hypothetical protein
VKSLFFVFFVSSSSLLAAFPTIACENGADAVVIEEGIEHVYLDLTDMAIPGSVASTFLGKTESQPYLLTFRIPKQFEPEEHRPNFATSLEKPLLFSMQSTLPVEAAWTSVSSGKKEPFSLERFALSSTHVKKEGFPGRGNPYEMGEKVSDVIRIELKYSKRETPEVEETVKKEFPVHRCKAGERAVSPAR